MKSKIMDVKQPTDDWEKGYALLQYQWVGLNQVLAKRIKVSYNTKPCNCSLCDDRKDMWPEVKK